MEGLIPYLYRAIKRKKASKYYRSMSTGASQWFHLPNTHKFLRPPPIELGNLGKDQTDGGRGVHRRHRSLDDFSAVEVLAPEEAAGGGHLMRVAVPARSASSRMLACITGG